MKILFAADGSAYTQRALDYLVMHDWLRAGNQICVFYAALPVPHRAADMAGRALTHHYYEDEAEQVMRPIRERLAGAHIEAEYAHVAGHTAESIVQKAEAGGFDLIVMGSHGHGALAGVVMGSVATRVLASCKVPVLLIR